MSENLKALAQQTGELLLAHDLKLATAESCTGGGLSYLLTEIPGSSRWFDRGFVTYSNLSKEQMLNVKKITLAQFGAVSEQIAQEMAEGALQQSKADITIAITGIAGPDGGTPEKPVGTIWIAWAFKQKPTETQLHLLSGDRHGIREQTIRIALSETMKKQLPPPPQTR